MAYFCLAEIKTTFWSFHLKSIAYTENRKTLTILNLHLEHFWTNAEGLRNDNMKWPKKLIARKKATKRDGEYGYKNIFSFATFKSFEVK